MKLISQTLTAVAAILAITFVACGTNETPKAQQPQIVKTTINLPTMKCKTCARHITNAVKNVDGVSECNVSVDDKNVVVSYAADKADLPKIEQAIAKVGYDANSTKRDEAAYGKLDECCK